MSVAPGTQRVALVTGGARRIGAAIAHHLASRGFTLVIHTSARSEADAHALVARLTASGARAASIVADLADASQADTLIARAMSCFGPLDVLVNNASIFEDDRIDTFDAAAFERHSAINLRAPLQLAKHFAKQASAAADASIVNLLDQRVFASNPHYLSYTLSKIGLASATTMLAQALAPRVRVNAVAPGPVLPNVNEGDARFHAEVAQVPLARPVTLEAIAEAVDYLVNGKNVTGQIIAVDSGQRLAWRTPDVLASMTPD